MKVSIITATYNSASTIKDTVMSVNQQTHRDIEHIVVDGISADNTLALLSYFGHSGPVISEADNGIYDAMNKGVDIAKGDIIGILNSDDFYPHHMVIEQVVKTFEKGNCDAVYGDLVYVDPVRIKKVLRKWVAGKFNKRLFYKGWMPPHPTFFVKKEVYEKYGNFNIDFKSSSDYELLLRFLLLKDVKVKDIPGVLVHMRAGGHSNKSLKNRIAAHLEDYRAWETNGITPKWYTLAMKPLRKVKQYIVADKAKNSTKFLFRNFFSSNQTSRQV